MTEPRLPRPRAVPDHLRLAAPAGTPAPAAPRRAPTIHEDLVVHLEQKFPEVDPVPGLSNDDLRFLMGRRDLVRYLRLLYEQQTKES